MSQEEKANLALRKEAQVTLYRNYRVGDFPDIQIPYSNLIAPFQALAQVRLPTPSVQTNHKRAHDEPYDQTLILS